MNFVYVAEGKPLNSNFMAAKNMIREISRLNAQPRRIKTNSRAFASTSRLLEGTKPELPAFDPSPAFRLTRSPNPSWKTGQGLSNEEINAKAWKKQEEEGWETWDLKEMQPKCVWVFRN